VAFVLRQDQPVYFHDLTATPLPSLEAVIETLEGQTTFDLHRAAEVVRTAHDLTHRHVKWRQPGVVKPAFSRLLTQAVRRMEDDGRIQ
jgi:hypothetical protein